MDNITRDHVIAAAIGGVTTLALHALFLKVAPGFFGIKDTGKSSASQVVCDPKVTTIHSTKLPPAIGPYSSGKKVGCCGATLMYSSGQLPFEATSGNLVSEDIEVQVDQALKNLKNLAEDNGLSLADVVKNNLFITDMREFGKINEVYARYFTSDFPGRTCVACKELPKGARFEIEAVFFRG